MRNTTTIQSGYHLIFRHLFSVCLACLFVLLICTISHAAGINTDGSLGPATTLTPGGPKGNDYTIPSNLGQQKGSNLFHSFGNFNVGEGESATFTGNAGTTNVIGRVTGGNSSWIDGRLGCDITGANLWLLNPFGILFGSKASLNVNGSFHASTADYLQLSDGGVFYTDPSKTSKLTIAAPSAFGFLSSKPAEINIVGCTLKVPESESISITGGDIRIENGHLVAPNGRVNLASLGSPGTVEIVSDGLNVEASNGLGNINISNSQDTSNTVSIDVSGVDSGNNSISGSVSGSVDIYCKTFSLDHSEIYSDNYSDLSKGGEIRLVAEESASIDNYSLIGCATYGKGSGGDIDIQSDLLTITSDSSIMTFGSGGNAGDIKIHSDLIIDASSSELPSNTGIISSTEGGGKTGAISIQSKSIVLKNGGIILSFSDGSCSEVNILSENILIDGVFNKAVGWKVYVIPSAIWIYSSGKSSANLIIKSDILSLLNGGTIFSQSDVGNNGDINITSKFITVGGVALNAEQEIIGRSSIFNGNTKSGKAGNIIIETEYLQVLNGGWISTNTLNEDAGDISIKAHSILLDGGKSENVGRKDIVSNIQALSKGDGNSGNILVVTDMLELTNGGQILTLTVGKGKAGLIDIHSDTINIDGVFVGKNTSSRSGLSSQAQDKSEGSAGQILIDAKTIGCGSFVTDRKTSNNR